MSSGQSSDGRWKGEAAEFWIAAAAGKLVLPKCGSCQRYHWYPRASCPFCASTDITWPLSPGRGNIYASTVFRRGPMNRIIAYVELDEGIRLLTNIIADDTESVAIGQRVEVIFRASPDDPSRSLPFFRRV